MKRVVLGLVLIYSCCAEYSLEAGKIKVYADNNDLSYYSEQLTCKEKYPRILAQHGFVAQIALKNHRRTIAGFKVEAEEKRLRERETREREERCQLLEQASSKKSPNQRKFGSRHGHN